MGMVPAEFRWLFWDVDFETVDAGEHADFVLARVLEFGRMAEVRWSIATYGVERIHRFLRDCGHPELSERTVAFWRAVLNAEEEEWAKPPPWRRSRIAPWNA
jgi:hypothetical protein